MRLEKEVGKHPKIGDQVSALTTLETHRILSSQDDPSQCSPGEDSMLSRESSTPHLPNQKASARVPALKQSTPDPLGLREPKVPGRYLSSQCRKSYLDLSQEDLGWRLEGGQVGMAQPRSTEQVRVSGAAKGDKGLGSGSGGSCCGRPVAHPISRSLGGGRPHGYQLSGV